MYWSAFAFLLRLSGLAAITVYRLPRLIVRFRIIQQALPNRSAHVFDHG
jgi:hypothetical protein